MTLQSPYAQAGLRKGRNVADGYTRGWGLQFGDLKAKISSDPLYQEALALTQGRSIQDENCRMNLYLLIRYYLPLIDSGAIAEFGCYRGGSTIFMAAVCEALGYTTRVYGFDTFTGMPETDSAVDAHGAGCFADVSLDELREHVERIGLSDRLTFVQGLFQDTVPNVLHQTGRVALAHIDYDIHSAVTYAYEAVKPHMVAGGYIAFDDAHVSSCIGATEAVEDLVIRRDGLNSEQIWPHFVFRIF